VKLRHAIFLLLGTLASLRADSTWTGPLFGDWFAPGNWSGGLPDTNNTALIDAGIAANAANASTASAKSLTLAATNTGATAYLGISNNSFVSSGVVIGRDTGSTGFLSVGSNSEFRITVGLDGLQVGQSGSGTLTVASGGEVPVFGLVKIGVAAGGTGLVSVSGAGSQLRLFAFSNGGGTLVIGDYGTGELQVNDAGLVSGPDVFDVVTGDNGGHGKLTVHAATLRANEFYAGYAGSSDVLVNSGGTIVLDERLMVRSITSGVSSKFTVDDSFVFADSLLIGSGGEFAVTQDAFVQMDTTLTIGGNGSGAASDATLKIAASQVVAASFTAAMDARSITRLEGASRLDVSNATLSGMSKFVFVLEGPAAADHAVLNAGTLALDGTLSIVLGNGYAPQYGDTFTLFNSPSLSGAFDTLDLPGLQADLHWNTDSLHLNGTLSVVPESSSAVLAALGLAALLLRRGRLPATTAGKRE